MNTTQAATGRPSVAKPQITVRLEPELMARLERVMKAARTPFGQPSKTDVVSKVLELGLPIIERELGLRRGLEPDD